MKAFNTIVVFDVVCIAESEEAAQAAVLALIRDQAEPLAASESTALEARKPTEIRKQWVNERPIVGADVSDEDFETLKGKTVMEVHAMLYAKPEKAAK